LFIEILHRQGTAKLLFAIHLPPFLSELKIPLLKILSLKTGVQIPGGDTKGSIKKYSANPRQPKFSKLSFEQVPLLPKHAETR
jgi:hypothetical protein